MITSDYPISLQGNCFFEKINIFEKKYVMINRFVLIFIFALSRTFIAADNANYRIANNQIQFVENRGQVYDQDYKPRQDVLFSGTDGQFVFHINTKGVSYQIQNPNAELSGKTTIHRIDLDWLGMNKNVTASKGESTEGYSNYYLASCPNGILNVRAYKEVTLYNIYNNINVHYYGSNGNLKCDYIVKPNTDYKQIQIEVNGAEVEIAPSGNLLLKTPYGIIEEDKPVVFQDGAQLDAEWVVNQNIITYNIKNYNKSKELIIDPVTRVWGTYYGDSGADYGYVCESDAANNVYLSGRTASWVNIATTGAHQIIFNGGSDMFLAKISANGVRQWCTYYGGTGNDIGQDCAINTTGDVYVAGFTQSVINISTAGAHQVVFGGGTNDAFLVKFNSLGQRQWGTYYGGSGDDGGYSCALDGAGNVYLCGYSGSTSNIATAAAHQTVFVGGPNDGFLAKFNSSGLRLWGTYYGGSNNDIAYQCMADASGNVYFAGSTLSTNSISTTSSQQATLGGGVDACLAKFNSTGTLQWATYAGGSGTDNGYSCALDATGNIYLAGATQSTNNIASGSTHQLSNNGLSDGFLLKYNNSGVLQWGTYYGGTNDDYVRGCATDALGSIYLVGQTLSLTSISTAGAIQPAYAGGTYDGFIVQFNSAGIRQWGSYYGGNGDDGAYYCSVNSLGNVYVTGYSSSTNNMASPLSYQTNFGGVYDAFLVKFGNCTAISPNLTVNNPVCVGANVNFSAAVTSTTVLNYIWQGPNSYTSSIQNPTIVSAVPANAGTYTLTAYDSFGCSENSSVTLTVSTCTNIKEETMSMLSSLYPNPNNGHFILETESDGLLYVCNALGQELYIQKVISGKNSIRVEDLSNGVYFVRLMCNNREEFFKIIIN